MLYIQPSEYCAGARSRSAARRRCRTADSTSRRTPFSLSPCLYIFPSLKCAIAVCLPGGLSFSSCCNRVNSTLPETRNGPRHVGQFGDRSASPKSGQELQKGVMHLLGSSDEPPPPTARATVHLPTRRANRRKFLANCSVVLVLQTYRARVL